MKERPRPPAGEIVREGTRPKKGSFLISSADFYELCKCQAEAMDWEHHKQYCPIWKNGRIKDLELKVSQYDYDNDQRLQNEEYLEGRIAELESFIRDFEDYRPSDGEAMREFQSMAKELLKQHSTET